MITIRWPIVMQHHKHLVRVEKLWDIPIRPTIDEDGDSVMHAVRRCCRLLHVDSYIADGAAREAVRILHGGDRRFMKEPRIWGTTQNEAYTADMTVDTSEVLVPDGKENNTCGNCRCCVTSGFCLNSPCCPLLGN